MSLNQIAASGFLALASSLAQASVSCTATGTGPAFGIYNPAAAAPANTTGNIAVTCSLIGAGAATVSLQVSLSAGSAGTFAPRTMKSAGRSLDYNLYFNASYGQTWGDGTGGTHYGVATLNLTAASTTGRATGTIYAQAPAGQDVAPGTYLDTIVMTINY